MVSLGSTRPAHVDTSTTAWQGVPVLSEGAPPMLPCLVSGWGAVQGPSAGGCWGPERPSSARVRRTPAKLGSPVIGEHKSGTAVLKLVCRVTPVRESYAAHTAILELCFIEPFSSKGTLWEMLCSMVCVARQEARPAWAEGWASSRKRASGA